MIIQKQGNVLDVEHGIIVHGCNSKGVMGSGLAKEVKARYPEAFEQYRNEYNKCISQGLPGLPLGSFTFRLISHTKVIINAVTQEKYGRDKNIVYVDYFALQNAFINIMRSSSLKDIAIEHGLHFPLIGCGLANGDWNIVSTTIDKVIPDTIEKTLWNYTP